jgi:hypothetical protein
MAGITAPPPKQGKDRVAEADSSTGAFEFAALDRYLGQDLCPRPNLTSLGASTVKERPPPRYLRRILSQEICAGSGSQMTSGSFDD